MKVQPTILVVDDDPDVREMIVDYLLGQGFGVAQAEDAQSMRAVLGGTPVDLVLLDRTMPDGDGLRLVPELRQGYRLPVIMLTALGAEEERVRGLDDGADDYVTKPFHWRELLSRVNSVLRRSVVGRASPSVVGRRTAAVLSADVAQYVRLMQADEEGTLRAWWLFRQTVIDPALAAQGGRMVKHTGDGFLAEFSTTDRAVAAALAIQNGVGARNRDVPADRRMCFRIGINWCAIVADGEDIYGDGVNLAARLQASAEPGSVWLSEPAHATLDGTDGAAFEPVGPLMLKHMAVPVRAYRWLGRTDPYCGGVGSA